MRCVMKWLDVGRRAPLLASGLVTVALAALTAGPAAYGAPSPVSGTTPWAVLRCRFADQPLPQVPDTFWEDFFEVSGSHLGGLYDYWSQVSYGQISLDGTHVLPWVPLKIPSSQDASRSRQQQVQDCVDAYHAAYPLGDLSNYYGLFIVQNNMGGEFGSAPYPINVPHCVLQTCSEQQHSMAVAFFEWGALNITNATHEMGHGYGLDHGWDTASDHWCGSSNGGYGEYCDYWETMGAPLNNPNGA